MCVHKHLLMLRGLSGSKWIFAYSPADVNREIPFKIYEASEWGANSSVRDYLPCKRLLDNDNIDRKWPLVPSAALKDL